MNIKNINITVLFVLAIIVGIGLWLSSFTKITKMTVPFSYIRTGKGNTYIKKPNSTDWIVAKDEAILEKNDTIKTEENSTAQLYFFDSSIVRLDQNTSITLSELNIHPNNLLNSKITIDVGYGHFWTKILNLLSTSSTFSITADDAVVVAKGTSIETSFPKENQVQGDKELTVSVIEGYVILGNSKLSNGTKLYSGQNAKIKTTQNASNPNTEILNNIETDTNKLEQAGIMLSNISENTLNNKWFENNKALDSAFLQKIHNKKQEQIRDMAGALPDSSFYGLKKKLEYISLMFTFNDDKEAIKKINFINREVQEAQAIAFNGKTALGLELFATADDKLTDFINTVGNKKKYNKELEEKLIEHRILLHCLLPDSDIYNMKKILVDKYVYLPVDLDDRAVRINEYRTLKQKEIHEMLADNKTDNIGAIITKMNNNGEIKKSEILEVLKQIPLDNKSFIERLQNNSNNLITADDISKVIKNKTIITGNNINEDLENNIEEENVTDNMNAKEKIAVIDKLFTSLSTKEDLLKQYLELKFENNLDNLKDYLNSFDSLNNLETEIKNIKLEITNPKLLKEKLTIIDSFIEKIQNSKLLQKYVEDIYDNDVNKIKNELSGFNDISIIKQKISEIQKESNEFNSEKLEYVNNVLEKIKLEQNFDEYLLDNGLSIDSLRRAFLQLDENNEILDEQEKIINKIKEYNNILNDKEEAYQELVQEIFDDINNISEINDYIVSVFGDKVSLEETIRTYPTITKATEFVDTIRQTAMINKSKQEKINKLIREIQLDNDFQTYLQSRNITTSIIERTIHNFKDLESTNDFIDKLYVDYNKYLGQQNLPSVSNSVPNEDNDEPSTIKKSDIQFGE